MSVVVGFFVLVFHLFLLIPECKSFWYGDDCSKKCNCLKETEVCDTKTGYCKSGCPEDWFGSACDSKIFFFSL